MGAGGRHSHFPGVEVGEGIDHGELIDLNSVFIRRITTSPQLIIVSSGTIP